MNAAIFAVGRLKEDWQRAACAEYLKRLSRYGGYQVVEVEDEREPDKPSPALETRVQFYEDWLADEGNCWQIKRETIEEFRQMVREYPLHLHAESPFLCEEGTSTYQLMRDACEKYASGLSSLDGFLAELSTKMRMVEAENL